MQFDPTRSDARYIAEAYRLWRKGLLRFPEPDWATSAARHYAIYPDPLIHSQRWREATHREPAIATDHLVHSVRAHKDAIRAATRDGRFIPELLNGDSPEFIAYARHHASTDPDPLDRAAWQSLYDRGAAERASGRST